MTKKAVVDPVRRSKRQAGLEVSPGVSLDNKKQKKDSVKERKLDNLSQPCEPVYEEAEEEQVMTSVMNEEEDKDVEEEVRDDPIPPSTTGVSNSSDAPTQQSENKEKKKRGPTKLRRVAKHVDDKIEVEWNGLGVPVGSGSVVLSSFLGTLAREYVPVVLHDWRHMDEKTKDAMWDEIQGRFNMSEDWQKDVVFKQMGTLWRSHKSRITAKVMAIKNKDELMDIKPSNVQSISAWNTWVKSRKSPAFQEQSEKYRKLRKNQIPQTTSRKGMNRLAEEMKKNSDDPKKVTRTKVWLAGHTHSDGRPVREEFAGTIEKIKTIDSEMDSNDNDNITDDAVTKVLGKDKPGRVRGLGRGVTVTKLAFLQARDTHVQKLEANQAELLSKIEMLQNVVNDLAGKKKQADDVSELSDVSKGGIRCQLLDWFSPYEVVVGEAEFCSSETTYKIGRIPLGPNAAAVIVKSVSDVEATVWRPTSTIGLLTDVVGVKIAWPVDKVILDSENQFHETDNTVGSEATNASMGKVQLFDYWNDEQSVIAEGSMMSTDPCELVNDVPLGMNAAIVQIDHVFKQAAFLWRPLSGMTKMGDALHETIAWPIDKLRLPTEQAVDASTKITKQTGSPSTGNSGKSTSPSTGSSKGEKKKCALLNLDGSGKTVAIGCVFSTDPADKVHFVPLGPNASKVWVQVSKVDNARVWRPSSEVEVIADAVGSTVAWPNDKLRFL